ncbi:DUF3108 domain-containing protein [Perlucidibaca piscinae]|uniref:DUF3108 domain-containing protein n=1 Tax=Perlucidibaca piscinae TaxID=392589 RepID=UPI0003B6CB29|nr:DUF3108 domain-containing protein [Perlucidibaca piscinae]
MRITRPLKWALLASALAHVVWFVEPGEWRLPWQDDDDTEVLEKKAASDVKRVRLAIRKAVSVAPGIPTVTLLKPALPEPAASPQAPAAAPVKKPAATAAAAGNSTAEKRPDQTETPVASDDNAGASAGMTANEPEEPAPSFPVAVKVLHRASYQGFTLDLKQQWLMEGDSYLINNEARKFGFSARISSSGKVSPEGLQPEQYRLQLNRQLKHYADFDRSQGVVVHGKAGQRKTTPITADFQDMASLPFHVAVSYEGQKAHALKVTTGSAVYDIVLQVVAEETLKLPGGTLRTLHLTGSRTRSDGRHQQGYDIWLAPDLRNFPVKFRGPDSKGNLLDMAVMSMSFDGRRVFGEDAERIALPEVDEPVPENLKKNSVIELPEPEPAAAAEPQPDVMPAATAMPEPEAASPAPVSVPE